MNMKHNSNKHGSKNKKKSASAKQRTGDKEGFYEHDRVSLSSISLLDEQNKPNANREHRDSSIVPPPVIHRQHSLFIRNWAQSSDIPFIIGANITEDNRGVCAKLLLGLSWLLIFLFFPFSLFTSIKVVQEYE